MLKEILISNLNVLFVDAVVAEASDDLGFHHLGAKDKFWEMLEYSGIAGGAVVSKVDRKALDDAKHTGVLNDIYKQFFFEKKESVLLKSRIGLTDLNRRVVVRVEDDPGAQPTPDDVQKFVKKVEKFRPKVVAFVMNPETFEKCFKPLYAAATRERGKQEFRISESEVWLLGSMSVRPKDADAVEQLFDDLAERLSAIAGDNK